MRYACLQLFTNIPRYANDGWAAKGWAGVAALFFWTFRVFAMCGPPYNKSRGCGPGSSSKSACAKRQCYSWSLSIISLKAHMAIL